MTLYRALFDSEPGLRLKLGSQGGRNFFYVGTVRDMLEKLDVYDQACKKNIVSMQLSAERAVKEMLDNYPSPAVYAKTQMNKQRPDLSVDSYKKELDGWFRLLSCKIETQDKRKTWFTEYVSLRKRKVTDMAMCDPIIDPGVLRIVIEGHEIGQFWTTDEAKKLPALGFASMGGGKQNLEEWDDARP